MLSSLCRRALGHMLMRSRPFRRVSSICPQIALHQNNAVCVRTLPLCSRLSTAPHPGSSGGPEQPSVEQVLRRFSSRRGNWHLRPVDSLLTALRETDEGDRARNCLSILNACRGIAAGRTVTAEHLEEVWRLVTEGAESPPSADAILQHIQLYTDAALPPPPSLTSLVTSRTERPSSAAEAAELVGELVHCLCAAGRLADAVPVLDRLRDAGGTPPQHALHAVIVAHAASGDLDTARDLAQALLPASEDSGRQFLLLRAQVAAGRPGPLSGLLARRYQQHGPLTLRQSVALLEALALTGQLEHIQQVVPLVPWSEYGPRGGCVRLQRLLVRLGRPRVALHLLSSALAQGGSDRELVRLAKGLVTEMAVTEQPVSTVAEVCSSLSAGPLLPSAWFWAAELLYRLGRWREALELLLRAHRAGLPLREHLFWPALLQQANSGDVEGVLDTVSSLLSCGLSPGPDTLRDYVLPVYLSDVSPETRRPPAELVVQRLKETGLTVAAVVEAMVARLMMGRRWEEAAAVCERYSASISAPVLISSLLHSLHLSSVPSLAPVPPIPPTAACVRLLRCAFQTRGPHEDPVGAVVLEMAAAAGRSRRNAEMMEEVVKAAHPAGLRISPAAAELACERLQLSAERLQLSAEQLQLAPELLQLADDAVSSRPWESLEFGAGSALAQDASVDELEDHLVELTKKGGNTRGVFRKLILMHCRKHNLERALELEAELTRLSDSDSEPLTPGLLAALLSLHVHHGRLEEALGYKRRLECREGADGFLDQFKRLDLATLMVRRGHSEDAVCLLDGLEPESDRARLSMASWRLLAAAADWADPQLASRLLQLLTARGVLTPSGHHWGQLVRAHIVSGDLSGAVAEFRRCAEEQRMAAYSHGLMLEVARQGDADRRHQLLDDVVQKLAELHGPDSAQYDLALALSEAGHVLQARRIMQSLGLAAHFTSGRLKRHCNRLSRAGQVEGLVRLLQAVPHREARLAVYWALLNAYERTGDLASVDDVITQLEERELLSGKILTHARQLAERLRSR